MRRLWMRTDRTIRAIPSQKENPTSRYSPNSKAAKAMLYTGSRL